METSRILVVDDEAIARENLAYVLRKEGHTVVCAQDGAAALQALAQAAFDLVMTDLRMQHVDGMQVLAEVKKQQPSAEVIVITGYATVNTAVEAMRAGAFFYVSKPYQIEDVRMLVQQALEKRSLRRTVSELKSQIKACVPLPAMIGHSPKMEALKKALQQIAVADCAVVILGETGTGKELVARTIHHLSPRANQRFLAVNCGAFNEELLSNELFGHEKEAFTGARGVKKGLFETVQGGTILLDEIADMPLAMQVKLLRVLQEKSLMRVGGTEEIPVDLRVLAATNKDLRLQVEKGLFRHDLYFRLSVMTVIVPPLSERREDIPMLAKHFLRKYGGYRGTPVEEIDPAALETLMAYEFPGNVRELENIMERAAAVTRGPSIEVQDLPPDLQQRRILLSRGKGFQEFLTLEENEREYIAWILKQVNHNKTRAAEILGIDRVSLWRKLRRYQMDE
ncbi:MAG: sigma-54-dependent Fis family transcriptional regulator [Desulfobacterales bacterium]|nr:sigma-54-dependent Fis family transcriptional regulator [Desulfobacterales bacterium]